MSMTATSGRNPPGLQRVQQRHGEAGLLRLGRLYSPGQRQAPSRANGLVELVAVEAPDHPGAHGGAVASGGVGVAVGLALRAALVDGPDRRRSSGLTTSEPWPCSSRWCRP